MKECKFSKKIAVVLLALAIVLLCDVAAFFETTTFVIYDGEHKTVSSRRLTAEEFVKEVSSTISTDEYIEKLDNTKEGLVEFRILKKNVLTIKVDGGEITAYAKRREKISDVLSQNGIILGAEDSVSHPVDFPADDGLVIEIKRISTQEIEEIVEIPFETEEKKNGTMNKGTSKVLKDGVKGSKKIVYRTRTENGVEVERTVVSETVIKKPVKKVVEVGTYDPNQEGTLTLLNGEKLRYKKVLNMTATAYTTERTSDKITATGKVAQVGYVAVDRRVIPLGSRLYICSPDGKKWVYGVAVAEDTGVRGNKIDLFFNTYNECISFGIRKAKVYILK